MPSITANAAFEDPKSKKVLDISKAIDDIEKYLTGKVPLKLLNSLLSAVSGIARDVHVTTNQMALYLTSKLKKDVEFCVEHVVFTETGKVDMTETIRKILGDSELNFDRIFLSHHCVDSSEVRRITNKLPMFKNLSIERYWEQHQHFSHDVTDSLPAEISPFQYVAVKGDLGAVKYFYDKACNGHKSPTAREAFNREVFQAAEHMFRGMPPLDADKIAFFYEKLSPERWQKILCAEFSRIFLVLLDSWRHRHLCVQFYLQVKDTLDRKTIQTLLKNTVSSLGRESKKYDYSDIVAVVRRVWVEIPNIVKAHKKTKFTLIPELVLVKKDLEALDHFLNDYDVEVQDEILAYVTFRLVSKTKDNANHCLKAARDLGLEAGVMASDCGLCKKLYERKQFLTKEHLKTFLIFDSKIPRADYTAVSKFMCDTEEDEQQLKQALFQDKEFVIDYLVNCMDDTKNFLIWGLGDQANITAFKTKLVETEWINEIYERRLIERKTVYDADGIFFYLGLDKQVEVQVQQRVKDNPVVVQTVLSKFPEFPGNFLQNCGFTKEESSAFMRQLLSDPEFLEAFHDMILDFPSFESAYKEKFSGINSMKEWHNIYTQFVQPYMGSDEFTAVLMANRRKVFKKCYEKVQRCPAFRRLDEKYAKRIIKVRFDCFLISCDYGLMKALRRAYSNILDSYNLPFMETVSRMLFL